MKDFDPKKPSQGLGDSIAKVTHALGIDKLADKVAKALGEEDCGCDKRRELLNELIPYKKPTPDTTYFYKALTDIQANNGVEYKAEEIIFIDEDHALYPELEKLIQEGKLKQQQ